MQDGILMIFCVFSICLGCVVLVLNWKLLRISSVKMNICVENQSFIYLQDHIVVQPCVIHANEGIFLTNLMLRDNNLFYIAKIINFICVFIEIFFRFYFIYIEMHCYVCLILSHYDWGFYLALFLHSRIEKALV